MAEYRPKVPAATKRLLYNEVGGKCANPGCSNRVLEIHHIKEWHVYKSHDADHMICLCPSCHDAVDRGLLVINDKDLYRWKTLRSKQVDSTHIYVEPSGSIPKIMLGTVSVQSSTNFYVFDISEFNKLEFFIRDGQILLPKLQIGNDEKVLIDVVDGYVISKSQEISFKTRAGKVEVVDSTLKDRIPNWALEIIRFSKLDINGLPCLEIETFAPGILKIKGIWIRSDLVIVIGNDMISFIRRGMMGAVSIRGTGDGTESILMITSTSILFAFE